MGKLEQFNECFTQNYEEFRKYANTINLSSNHNYDDLLHRSYLKCFNAIAKGNYVGNNYESYIYVTIKNTYLTMLRDSKTYYDITEENTKNIIEQNQPMEDEFTYQEKILLMQFLINGLYDYVDKYYINKDAYLFRIYYKLNKKINYKQLSEISGYSISTVSNVIKGIKKDLNKNYKYFVEFGMKKDEIESLIKKTEDVMKLDVVTYFQIYNNLHKEIYGSPYNGCKCTPYRLKNKIQQWLVSAQTQLNKLKNENIKSITTN